MTNPVYETNSRGERYITRKIITRRVDDRTTEVLLAIRFQSRARFMKEALGKVCKVGSIPSCTDWAADL